jgi:F0F1-type ATP synthase delta subunit
MTTAIDLSAFFQTKAQATDFSSRLSILSEKIYATDFNLEKALMELLGLKKKEAFIALLRDNNISSESNTALQKFVIELQKTIAELPLLSLSIAFEPKESTLKALSEWFVLNIKRQLLLEIKIDKKIIAGAAISFNGKDADFSIRSTFDTTVKELLTKPAEKVAA